MFVDRTRRRWHPARHQRRLDGAGHPGHAGLAETVLPWRDVLHEGPVPDVPDAELRRIRARFLAGENAADIGTLAEFERRDRTLAEHRDGRLRAVVRGRPLRPAADRPDPRDARRAGRARGARHADLHRRARGLRALRRARRAEPGAARPPARDRRHGAHARGAAITPPAPGRRCARPSPSGLRAIAATPSAELRFLAEAFDRLGREYPSTRDGLSLTERRILAAVAEGAPDAGAAFVRAAREGGAPVPRRHVGVRPHDADGDLPGAAPRLRAGGAGHPPHAGLQLTATGRRVLDGDADHVALNGVDRWIGGVHLQGRDVPWRWDEGTESVATAG